VARAAAPGGVVAADMVTPLQRRVEMIRRFFFAMATNKQAGGSKKKKATVSEDALADRIQSLLERFEYQTNDSNFKISVGDYIRLIQLKNELEDNQPQDIEVRWVDNLSGTDEPEA
jgi:hypothetical protein